MNPRERPASLKMVFIGLSITSSWGNGHATTYRGLVRELVSRGHDVLFLERDMPWYAANRDLPAPPYGRTEIHSGLPDLARRFTAEIRDADFVMVGSYVPEGAAIGEWVLDTARGVTAFYDIDTPVTLARLARNDCDYLTAHLIRRYHLYLSFTGGPLLLHLSRRYGARHARPLYCSFDPDLYHPEPCAKEWDLGYMGTYSDDRQPVLSRLLLDVARAHRKGRFVVAGPQYPDHIRWPRNVRRIEHLAPPDHRRFYNAQRFTLNVTREDMVRAGWSPSVRLFEAAACAVPIISDYWQGLEHFFRPGVEILLGGTTEETVRILREMSEEHRVALGRRARERVLAMHTSAHRAAELEEYAFSLLRRGQPVREAV